MPQTYSSNNHFGCNVEHISRAQSSGLSSQGSRVGPSGNFERYSGTGVSPSNHFEHLCSTRQCLSGHFYRSGSIKARPSCRVERSLGQAPAVTSSALAALGQAPTSTSSALAATEQAKSAISSPKWFQKVNTNIFERESKHESLEMAEGSKHPRGPRGLVQVFENTYLSIYSRVHLF